MKAFVYLGPGQAAVQETAAPVPGEGEGLVRVAYAGICGTDLSIAAGKHPRATAPLVLGHEFSGELVEINGPSGGSHLRKGDKVTAFPLLVCGTCLACRTGYEHVCRNLRLIGIDRDGAMAEYVSVPLSLLVKLDEEVDLSLGVLVEPLAVCVHSVRESRVQIGDNVLVSGCGPIGLLLALVLRHAGIERITLTEISPYRKDFAADLGFDVLDPTEEAFAQSVLDRSDGEGVDTLFEASAAPPAALSMAGLVRPRGEIVIVSVFKEPPAVDLRAINFKEIVLRGVRVYTRQDFQRAGELSASGKIPLEKMITHCAPLQEAPSAFDTARQGKDALKVLLDCQNPQ
ncbi:MAG TPA: alcohol dehydrogenase catalytic domain-containing protein [Candidatus Hydrogenedentes bacterium]|nr:alcohol dehydrogenase catalytic domain-containing protein [Candidatus Hydrogenedentota bacterium]